MTALPPDLTKLWDDMNAADRAAEAIAGRLTDEELFWQPDEGRRWSVALCLDHLAVANEVYGSPIVAAIEQARARGLARRGPAAPGFFGRKFVASLEPPVRRRTRAPRKIVPRPVTSRGGIMQAYRAAHDRIRAAIVEGATLDLNRAMFPNPFIPLIKVSVATGLNVVAAHDRRHLWQAEQVEKELRARSGR